MTRLQKLLNNKNKNILSIYFTAGYPMLNTSQTIIETLDKSGADLVEIGIPFSDPLADGPIIQASSQKALENGMNLKLLLEQLEKIRTVTSIPLILMAYYNPIHQYGMEKLLKVSQKIGIDALIIPDLPLEIYEEEYKSLFEKYEISFIFLVSPQTSEKRLQKIDELSTSFIYAVSSASTTGSKLKFDEQKIRYFQRLKKAKLKHPFIIGFGISDRQSFLNACKYSNGAIIGTAFIKAISRNNDLKLNVQNFISDIIE